MPHPSEKQRRSFSGGVEEVTIAWHAFQGGAFSNFELNCIILNECNLASLSRAYSFFL